MKLFINGFVEVPEASLETPQREVSTDGWSMQPTTGLYIRATVKFEVVSSGDASMLLGGKGNVDAIALSNHIAYKLRNGI